MLLQLQIDLKDTSCLITAYRSNTHTHIHLVCKHTHRHTLTNKAKSPIIKQMKPFLFKVKAEWRIEGSFLSNRIFKHTVVAENLQTREEMLIGITK